MNSKKEIVKTKVYTNNPDHLETLKSTKFDIILKDIDTTELEKEKKECEALKTQAKYIYSTNEAKLAFDNTLMEAGTLLSVR